MNTVIPGRQLTPTKDLLALLASLAVCAAASGAGGLITAGSVGTWYQTLAKPAFNPPDWIFAPVWTTLFVMMAVAAWRVWRRHPWKVARGALALHGIQLVLNVGWSALFFGMRSPGWAFAEVILLLAAIALTARAYAPLDRTAAWLMAPYAAWVAFATLLTGTIWHLN